MLRRNHNSCYLCGTKKQRGSYHRIPVRIDIRVKWLEALNLKNVNQDIRVCNIHFRNSDFVSPICDQNVSKKRLIKTAIPSLYLDLPTKYQRSLRAKSGKVCVICKENSNDQSYHRFPADPESRRKWLESLRDLPYVVGRKFDRICGKHFQPTDFGRRKLRKHAIPSLFLPGVYTIPAASICSSSTVIPQTDFKTPRFSGVPIIEDVINGERNNVHQPGELSTDDSLENIIITDDVTPNSPHYSSESTITASPDSVYMHEDLIKIEENDEPTLSQLPIISPEPDHTYNIKTASNHEPQELWCYPSDMGIHQSWSHRRAQKSEQSLRIKIRKQNKFIKTLQQFKRNAVIRIKNLRGLVKKLQNEKRKSMKMSRDANTAID